VTNSPGLVCREWTMTEGALKLEVIESYLAFKLL